MKGNNTVYGETACKKLFMLDTIYEYFCYLHGIADNKIDIKNFIEADNKRIWVKYYQEENKNKQLLVNIGVEYVFELTSDANKFKQIIRSQIIESMFSILEYYLENIYKDMINSNKKLLIEIEKQVSYKDITEQKNIIKYIIDNEVRLFSYKSIFEKYETIEKKLKIKTDSFIKLNRDSIKKMNELRQEIVHRNIYVDIADENYNKYFSLVYKTILWYDEKIIKYKEIQGHCT
jgi:hypothetical protein